MLGSQDKSCDVLKSMFKLFIFSFVPCMHFFLPILLRFDNTVLCIHIGFDLYSCEMSTTVNLV